MLQTRVGKLLAERMVLKENKPKLRADLEGYMSVSESENEDQNIEALKNRAANKAYKKVNTDKGQTGDQSSADKHMAAAMYSGLISHSDTSEEMVDTKRVFTNQINH